jgi:hypothetical protein
MLATSVTTVKLRNRNVGPKRRLRVRRPIDAQSWRATFVSAVTSDDGEIMHVNVRNPHTGGIYSVAPTSVVRVHNS